MPWIDDVHGNPVNLDHVITILLKNSQDTAGSPGASFEIVALPSSSGPVPQEFVLFISDSREGATEAMLMIRKLLRSHTAEELVESQLSDQAHRPGFRRS